MIAAIAYQLGHECDLYDLTTVPEGEEVSAFQSKLKSFRPDLLAVSCRSNEWSFVSQLLRSVNVGNILKVFGGPHTTAVPEEVINIADIVVIGEGEETFSELLTRMEGCENITNIAGCWIKQDSRVIKNEMRNLISNLDKLPIPYWKIFDDCHYYDSYVKRHFDGAKVVGTFEASRGCPYACTYCMNDYVRTLYRGKGKWRREKSPERIVQEAQLFREEYGLDCIYWIDEVVLTNIDRLERFRDLYASAIGVPFVFMERPENMIDEKVRIIKQAEAQMVSIGIESGDHNIRNKLLNRHHSQETIISAFQIAKKYGLATHAFTMIGFPGETRQSIKETYKLLRQTQPDTVQTTIFYPLKRTKLFEKVVNEGLFNPKTPMSKGYYGETSLNLPESQKKELLRWQYILTNYNRKFTGLFILAVPSQLIFRILVILRKVYIKFMSDFKMLTRQNLGFYTNKFLLNISRKYHLSRFYAGDPMVLELEVTTCCNLRCIQCSRQGEFSNIIGLNQNMPFDKFVFIIKQFPYLQRITFSGMGEPLLYPDIFKAVDYVKKVRKNITVAMSTNSTLFTDSKIVDRVICSDIDILQISWLGAKEETVEGIGGVKNFRKIVTGTKELIDKKPTSLRVHINFVVMEENVDELEEFVELVHSVGIRSINANRRNYLSYCEEDRGDADFYNSKELGLKVEKAKKRAKSLGIGFNYNPKPKCNSIWDYTTINVNGYVLPCGSFDMPKLCNLDNIFTQDKRTIYRSELLRSLRADIAAKRKPPFCKNCYLIWS